MPNARRISAFAQLPDQGHLSQNPTYRELIGKKARTSVVIAGVKATILVGIGFDAQRQQRTSQTSHGHPGAHSQIASRSRRLAGQESKT